MSQNKKYDLYGAYLGGDIKAGLRFAKEALAEAECTESMKVLSEIRGKIIEDNSDRDLLCDYFLTLGNCALALNDKKQGVEALECAYELGSDAAKEPLSINYDPEYSSIDVFSELERDVFNGKPEHAITVANIYMNESPYRIQSFLRAKLVIMEALRTPGLTQEEKVYLNRLYKTAESRLKEQREMHVDGEL